MLTLYQFPISHYCEKVRWALDYKQLDYQLKNLLPGLHVLTTKRLSVQTAVPILVDGDNVIYGSAYIINYLDNKFPQYNLSPEDPKLKEQAIAWEKYVDVEIGVHIRRCFYDILLEHPNIVIPFFAHNGSCYSKVFLKLMFPKIKASMKRGMNINKETAQRSKQHLAMAIDKIYVHLQDNNFLVGNQFTRADLAAASLLAPLCKPVEYGLNWPDSFPQPLQGLIDEFQQKTRWVNEVYIQHR